MFRHRNPGCCGARYCQPGGALLENLVVAELFKASRHRGEEPAMYFWRTAAGLEVDLIIETQAGPVPIEIKASSTARPEMAKVVYERRAWIETLFGSCKSCGLGLARTHLTIPEQICIGKER
ncbi:MAG: DUF4143 domain-containing protein [Anaerolineae bacterium]